MSDPIREALEAAGQAVARVQGYADDTTQDAANAAVAAFLRALPTDGSLHIPPNGTLLQSLAAAVEAAGGNDA